jgi:hypothetical protein
MYPGNCCSEDKKTTVTGQLTTNTKGGWHAESQIFYEFAQR